MSADHPIRAIRLQRLWTQRYLAHRAGITTITLAAIEGRRRTPRLATRRALLQALSLPLEHHLAVFGPLLVPGFSLAAQRRSAAT